MRSNSGSESTPLSISPGRASFSRIASVLLAAFLSLGSSADASVSFSEMALLSAAERTDLEQTLTLFRGYAYLGFRKEAAAYLEKKIHLAQVTREMATPLFEELVREQSRWDEKDPLLSICETAIRNGVRTSPILYSYGVALRQAGRYSDAKSILSQVGRGSRYFPYALYAIGQIAVEEGQEEAALEIFRRVRVAAGNLPGGEGLERRATRSQAGLLITLGRTQEAEPLLDGLRGEDGDPTVTVALEAVREDREHGTRRIFLETTARLPARERILLFLLRGGLARDRGRFDEAVALVSRAEEDLQAFIGSAMPPATETLAEHEATILLSRQIETHRLLRRILSSPTPGEDPGIMQSHIVELLAGLLFMDHSIEREQGRAPGDPPAPAVKYLTSAEVEEIFRKIEEVSLDGVEVDRLVEDLSRKVDVLQNLAHPIWRFRLLSRLTKSQEEIRTVKERIRNSREAAVAGVEAGKQGTVSSLLTEVGRFLRELGEIRAAAGELRAFTRRNFNILRRKDGEGAISPETVGEMGREALRYDADRFASLLPSVKALEEKARIVSWERKKRELIPLRPVVFRQKVDVLLARARSLRGGTDPQEQRERWASIRQAASYLEGDRLSPRDRVECAILIGSLLAEGNGRWELFPGRSAGEEERELIAALLPPLSSGRESGYRREESSYLLAVLNIRKGDPAGKDAARAFLREFPSSVLAGGLAVRLGHEALLAGRRSEAISRYRHAAEGSGLETTAVAHYMLAWDRFQGGDAAGATGEISVPLSDPLFPCEDPAPFEQKVLALAVRAWRETPLERLETYPPVREGACAGKRLLAALGEDEKKRGESVRAAAVFDLLSRRFATGEAALTYETKSVEELLRAGREDEAFARVLTLGDKYGPGSEWTKSQPPAAREKAIEELSGLLKSLSERKFEEGIQSGERSAMTSAKEGMERFFAVRKEKPAGGDTELRLKWGIASLKAGDREFGIGILKDLAENNADSVGERAGILHAETMIAGYERKEGKAEDAEASALLLLGKFPSEKAVSLAYRAAGAFLRGGEYERADRTAAAVVGNKDAGNPVRADALLIRAEASVFLNHLAAARSLAESAGADTLGKIDPKTRERAWDLYLLASLKEVEAKTEGKDWAGAASILEEVGDRFPRADDAPSLFLRAMRSYRLAGDREGATRVGLGFLERFPRREEALEVVGTVAPYLVEGNEPGRAATLYESASKRFPKSEQARGFLFLAARLSADHGDRENARKRFAAYRERFSNPRWMTAYATLSLGRLALQGGDTRKAIGYLEEGLRQLEAGVEKEAPREFFVLAGEARTAIGEYWADQFRRMTLTVPLGKTLAVKDRFFRRALASFDKARSEAPVEASLNASLRSGDLFVEFGKSILESQRPKGLTGEESGSYENALKDRARTFFERGQDRYTGVLDRIEAEEGPSELAAAIRQRLQEIQTLLSGMPTGSEAK